MKSCVAFSTTRPAFVVDRIDSERLPSPYLWQLLEDMEGRIARLHEDERHYPLMLQLLLPAQQQSSPPTSNTIQTIFSVATAVQTQQQALWTAVQQAAARSARVDQVRRQYDNYSRRTRTRTRHHYPYSNGNVLEAARRQEREHQQRIEDQIRGMYVQVAGTTTTTNTTGNTTTTTTLGTAGATTTTKPRVFSFSSSTFGAPTLAAPAAFGTAVFGAAPAFGTAPTFGTMAAPATHRRRPLARRRPLVVLCP